MKGTRFAHYTDEVFQKHTYGSENVTQGLLSCDNAGIGWDDTMWDPWYSYYQYISKLNLFLEKIDNVPGDETSRNEQKGQALFTCMELSHAIQLIRTCAYRRSYF